MLRDAGVRASIQAGRNGISAICRKMSMLLHVSGSQMKPWSADGEEVTVTRVGHSIASEVQRVR
jgi:hypothetical protein